MTDNDAEESADAIDVEKLNDSQNNEAADASPAKGSPVDDVEAEGDDKKADVEESPKDRGRSRSVSRSRSRSVSRSPRRSRSYSRSASYDRRRSLSSSRSRSISRSRSRSFDRNRRSRSPVRRRRRSFSRSRSFERRRGRSRSRSRSWGRDRSGRRDRGIRGRGPDVTQYRKPERWLSNLFEDGLKETLETTRLPCNVSKINDCMKKLDPTYHLNETGFPTFSTMCYWFDQIGGIIEISKHRDSVVLVSSPLEREVVKRMRSPLPARSGRRNARAPRPSRRRRGRSPLRRRSRSPGRGGTRGGRISKSPRRGNSRSRSRSPGRRSRSLDRYHTVDDAAADDRWQMA